MDRPLALPGRAYGRRSAPGSGRARHRARDQDSQRRILGGAASALAAVLAGVFARRRLRLACAGLVVAAMLAVGGFLLLRSSSLTAVRDVQVVGVQGPEAAAIDSALTEAARRMSTLAASNAVLGTAVRRFKIVLAVRAEASFPHRLRIIVTEQLPVAVLESGSERAAVAADGVVLGPALASGSLPTLAAPATDILAAHVTQSSLRAALTVLGAAPEALRTRVAGVAEGSRGLTVTMRNGLVVYFGDAALPHAKWLALARVLADASSRGASYIDVRSPARPAAGGFAAGTGPTSTASVSAAGAGTQTTPSQPTVSALAESLAAAVGGPAAASAPSTTPQEQSEQQSGGSGAPSVSPEGGAGGSAGGASSGGSGDTSGTASGGAPQTSSGAGEGSGAGATGGSAAGVPEGG